MAKHYFSDYPMDVKRRIWEKMYAIQRSSVSKKGLSEMVGLIRDQYDDDFDSTFNGEFEGIRYDPKDGWAILTADALGWDASHWGFDPSKLSSGNRKSRKRIASLSRRTVSGDYTRRTAWGHEILAIFMDASPFYPEPVLNVVTYSETNLPGLIWGRGYDTRTGFWSGADFNQSEKQIKARLSGMTLVYSDPEAYQRCIDRFGRHRGGISWE